MKKTDKQNEKKCLTCKREFFEDENYCPDDGSILEQVQYPVDYPVMPLAQVTADEVNAISKDSDADSGMPLARLRFVAGRSRSRQSGNGERQQKPS